MRGTYELWIVVAVLAFALLLTKRTEGFVEQPKHQETYRAYVIHLPRNVHRRAQFEENYTLDIPCDIISGIDGSSLDLKDMHEHGILGNAGLDSIQSVRRGTKRTEVRDLGSQGALGVYLSHCQLWEAMTREDAPMNMIIFEDDAIVQNWSVQSLTDALNGLPSDWHIYMLGAPHSMRSEVPAGNGVNRLTEFCGLHAYVINHDGAAWLWEHGDLMPVQQQIDTKLTDLTQKGLRVYIHPAAPLITPLSLVSDVQI